MINPWKPARRDPDLERIEQLYREYRRLSGGTPSSCCTTSTWPMTLCRASLSRRLKKSELISSLDCNKSRAYFVIMVRNLSYTLYRQQKRHPMVGLADLEIFSPTPMRSRRRR